MTAEDEVVIALVLAKSGFGSPEEILNMRADLVLDAFEYIGFLADYSEAYRFLNTPSSK